MWLGTGCGVALWGIREAHGVAWTRTQSAPDNAEHRLGLLASLAAVTAIIIILGAELNRGIMELKRLKLPPAPKGRGTLVNP